ncbi:hypothetical protein TIFTF001_018717 [Ficus carica]|uniref:Uncharacterized protein n=1 Tax=Ficus carica TaxID=3494 RepID=A0AA88ABK7_FICCA|nr:hypothetical protein TIFTF001_018717 [Ficus carica]
MATCSSWSSGKVAITRRLTVIPCYATTESTTHRSWSSGEVAISSPLRSDCTCDLITIDGMPNNEDDDKASSGKVAIARQLTVISSYVTTESAARRSWSSGEVATSSSSTSDCSRDLITIDGMSSDEDDNKARLATLTSQSRQR